MCIKCNQATRLKVLNTINELLKYNENILIPIPREYIQHFNPLDKAKFKTTHYRYPVYIEYMDRIFQFIECRHKIIIIADKYLNKLI